MAETTAVVVVEATEEAVVWMGAMAAAVADTVEVATMVEVEATTNRVEEVTGGLAVVVVAATPTRAATLAAAVRACSSPDKMQS